MSIRKGTTLISGSRIANSILDQSDNSTQLKMWTGTKAEYEAIAIKSDDTIYNITDDISWDPISAGQILSALNNKADTTLLNVSNTSGFRKLVDIYNNGASWYKVYAEYNPTTGEFVGNWCEQGGQVMGMASYGDTSLNVTFTLPMSDTNYTAQATPINNGGYTVNSATIRNHTTTGLSVHTAYQNSETSILASWYVCGYKANS